MALYLDRGDIQSFPARKPQYGLVRNKPPAPSQWDQVKLTHYPPSVGAAVQSLGYDLIGRDINGRIRHRLREGGFRSWPVVVDFAYRQLRTRHRFLERVRDRTRRD
jgi:hypothetical protein